MVLNVIETVMMVLCWASGLGMGLLLLCVVLGD